jgi:hypothetical protein
MTLILKPVKKWYRKKNSIIKKFINHKHFFNFCFFQFYFSTTFLKIMNENEEIEEVEEYDSFDRTLFQ